MNGTDNPSCLTVRNLRVRRGSQFTLEVASLELKTGTMTALLGLSGSGKTTLLRALAGRLPVAEGTINYTFTDRTFALPSNAASIGTRVHYVGQGQALLPYRTLRSNFRAIPTERGESNPSVLFVDEITSALDPPAALSLLKMLKTALARTLYHVIFVTHFVTIVQHVADDVLFIRAVSGRLESADFDGFTGARQ